MEIHNYKPGDETSILDIFKVCFHRVMFMEYWKWRYRDNPNCEGNMIKLAWDGKVLAAHYALSPHGLFIDGKNYQAALSMTTMTRPEYQGRGLFTSLAQTLYDDNKNNLNFVFGVPNENSVHGFVKKLNFKLIHEIPMLEKLLPERDYKVDASCQRIDRFDEQFDSLFSFMKIKYRIITTRTSEYLNWRFVDNPENDYDILVCREGERILGYLIAKIFNGNESITGDIVDFLVQDESVLEKLLLFAFSRFQEAKVTAVNTWCTDSILIDVLKRYGFHENGKQFHFIVRNNSGSGNEEVYDFQNWYITMSDIDIF